MRTYYAVGQGARDLNPRAFRDVRLPGRHLARVLDQSLYEASLGAAADKFSELSRKSGKQRDDRGSRMNQQPGQQSELSAPPFDPVFPRLVDEGGRPQEKIIGLLAYGLYQEAKRDWISEFFLREKRYPNIDELRSYELSWTTSRLEALHNAAAQLIAAYTDTVVGQSEKEILRSALKGSFWRSVWRWVVGALIYTATVVASIIALNKLGVDWASMFRDLAAPLP